MNQVGGRTGISCLVTARLAVSVLMFTAMPALAAEKAWSLSGDLAKSCTISYNCQAGDRCLQLRLEDRSTAQDTAVVTWRCNFAVDTATLEFESLNQGTLRNPQDDLPLPYLLSYTGGSSSGFLDQTLSAPVRTSASPDLAATEVSGILQIRIRSRTEALFAGRYSDRISVTIIPAS